jgi:Lrp/AsnC family transcriptional regulator for asnA, asnC and gidA
MKDQPSIEKLDLDILKKLSEDGRTNYHQIATDLGRSPVTIKKHVTELDENGIIKGYGISIDYEKLGYNIIAIIEVTISKGKMLEIEDKIAENPNVFGVYDITGDYDALILARFKDRTELSAMVKELHSYVNIERTNTHIILNVIKEGTSFSQLMQKENIE